MYSEREQEENVAMAPEEAQVVLAQDQSTTVASPEEAQAAPAQDAPTTVASPEEAQAAPAQETSIMGSSPEAWPEPVDGATLLDELAGALMRFVSITSELATAVALWVLFAHCHDSFRISPILALVSPTCRCGKTTLLSVLGLMVPMPLQASRVTSSAIYRAVDAHSPSMLIDEADSFLLGNEALRNILNSGHLKNSAYVVITVKNAAKRFSTWSPKVLALIGSLPETLQDRSIMIGLRRKAVSEKLERLTASTEAELGQIGSKCARWAQDHGPGLVDADPKMPARLHDRAADNWSPLLAIADLAGGQWPKAARKAAVALAGNDPTQTLATGELLLNDIQTVFKNEGKSRLPSQTVVSRLVEIEDRPWPEVAGGRPLTAPGLARLLKPFGIKPALMRVNGVPCRAYSAAGFQDAFLRYLPA